ncbi:MAG: DPP IV N-terminal domain-containing protein [Acidobacteriota bacterium]|nr:DPP IV N-terminal domain-containing protein [Acidobacteriota bacterium]
MPIRPHTRVLLLLLVAVTARSAVSQRQRTAEEYRQAERWMPYNVEPLLDHTFQQAAWLNDDRLWYADTAEAGVTYMLVDPVRRSQAPVMATDQLTSALNAATTVGRHYTMHHPDVTSLWPESAAAWIVTTSEGRFRCQTEGTVRCTAILDVHPRAEPGHVGGVPIAIAPDGARAVFLRDWNLWLLDLTTGIERQLTTDGVKNFGYATDNAGWTHSDAPIVVWSPDSRHIATYQQDQRHTGDLYLLPVTVGHPELQTLKYPLPGDAEVTTIQRVVVDVDTGKVVRLKMPPDQHRSSLCDNLSCQGGSGWDDVQWSADSRHLAFVSTSRDHKQEWMRLADARTGEVREVLHEAVPTYFESGDDAVNWRYLDSSNEVLWYSERSGWGQLYLMDAATGALKHAVTTGEGNVTQVLRVDEATRTVYFLAVGREPGRDPYYQFLYRVQLDGSGLQLLTPENASHQVMLSPDAHWVVDTYSTPTTPQQTVVRDANGTLVMPLVQQDITRLQRAGWRPLTPITVKARDNRTDLFGYMFLPTTLDPHKTYPIVDFIYPGPQTGSCDARTFAPAHGDLQSLAELGFVVVCIDGTGTPGRSKAFHDAHYGNLGDNTIPDQVAGLKDLARQYSFVDLNRVGIYGHSGGGYAAAGAMLHAPEFFRVGIAESGNQDNREYEDDWGEKWMGLLVRNPDGTSNYDAQANQNFAGQLQGHLLLIHGTMDDNVPLNNTLLLTDALIKANKDFDLLLVPNAGHFYGSASGYVTRRRWDYFVRYLAGDVPPAGYRMAR